MCFQLIHCLPDVGSHLSWLETEYKAGILMSVTLHPSSSLSTSLHIIFTSPPPPCFLSTHTLHSVCSTDFLPPVSLPHFYPPHLDSPDAAALRRPKFFLPALISFYPSLHLTSLSFPCCSVYHLPATLSSSTPPPSCLFQPAFLPIPLLSSASPCILPVSSALAFCSLSFSICPLSCSFGLPPAYSVSLSPSLSLSGLCRLIPGLCGSRG